MPCDLSPPLFFVAVSIAAEYIIKNTLGAVLVKGANIPKPGVPESFKVLVKELQALCLDIRVLDENGNEIELKDEDEDDEIIYTEHETELVVGSTEEVLDAGFTFDEDSPEGIFDDVFSSDADTDEE